MFNSNMDVLEIFKFLKERGLGQAWGNTGGKEVVHNRKYIFLPCFSEVHSDFFPNNVPNIELSTEELEKRPYIFPSLF